MSMIQYTVEYQNPNQILDSRSQFESNFVRLSKTFENRTILFECWRFERSTQLVQISDILTSLGRFIYKLYIYIYKLQITSVPLSLNIYICIKRSSLALKDWILDVPTSLECSNGPNVPIPNIWVPNTKMLGFWCFPDFRCTDFGHSTVDFLELMVTWSAPHLLHRSGSHSRTAKKQGHCFVLHCALQRQPEIHQIG